jgi:hypothetical protein
MQTIPSFSLALVVLGALSACKESKPDATATSSNAVEESDALLRNARISRTATQIRLESTAREACKGRQTIIDIRVGNNSAESNVELTAVAHGYRNGETVPVQITSIGAFTVRPNEYAGISFDGAYPAVKGSAIEVVSVTLDAAGGGNLLDLNVDARFTCGEEDRSDPGVDISTGEAQDPSQLSCADLAALKGAAAPMCEFNGNGACDGRGSRTNDCAHCCKAVAAGVTEPL